MPKPPAIVLVTPALAAAKNGNWQTAQRWARMLQQRYRVNLCTDWQAGDEALMIALHARRSAASMLAWRAQHPARPLLLVLTGTDLYQDIAFDAQAQRSLQLADLMVVLNELGAAALPEDLRAKARVCLQSSTARHSARPKTRRHMRAVMVGHLRAVKDPQCCFDAARLLAGRRDILLDHVGAALDPELGEAALALAVSQPSYRWLGACSHAQTRARIAAAHVLVHPSRLEGGAHAVIEAVVSGTPVLASRIDGNVGLLGADYAGFFEPGDAQGLARLLQRARDEPAMLPALALQCALRAPLFEPARERATLLGLMDELLKTKT
ncbi:selenoneine biosynthesis selenosugar synthase SenB [Roseateles sp.]|uniref:selenoneine biosynthesis selenosugar synthase SenB n=1 Tax=Roseateles sp. TaxID=1971397 RepID=UPI0037C4FE16